MADNSPVQTVGGMPLHSQFRQGSANDQVTVKDWQACVGANGLVVSCAVTTNDADASITSVGLLAYSADGQTQYCSQFTGGTGGNSVLPSVSSAGFEIKVGASVLGTVFGYVGGKEFFFEKELTVATCGP